jgi:TIR domain
VENQTEVTDDTGTAQGRLRIFLNYRRTDTEDAAGRLFDALCSHFGEHHVFMDIDDIEPGVDFDAVVHEAVGQCDVLLAVIGPSWLTVVDGQGRRRLDNPDDYVRIELQVALERNIRLVPVLIHDVAMPLEEELPEGLQRLAHKQAVGLSTTRWKYDLGKLIEALESVHRERPYSSDVLQAVQPGQAVEPATTAAEPTTAQAAEPTTAPTHAAPPPAHKPVRRGRRRLLWGAGGIVAIVVILVIIGAASGGGTAKSHAATNGMIMSTSCSGASTTDNNQPATINFVNSSKAQASIYWLSYTGGRELYETLPAGQQTTQSTYVGNKWAVLKSGACTAMTVAKAGTHTFVIH